eukprot:6805642-Pyramimonas_sp.AAC.1
MGGRSACPACKLQPTPAESIVAGEATLVHQGTSITRSPAGTDFGRSQERASDEHSDDRRPVRAWEITDLALWTCYASP